MNDLNKTKNELLSDLINLRKENEDLRALHTRDIAEWKLLEEKSRETEARFRNLFMNMNEGSALHELSYNDRGVAEDYIIIETNPSFEMILGLVRENVIGKTSREAYGVDEPPYFEIYRQVAITGEPIAFETYFPPLAKHFSISVYCPYKGSFATIFSDITERKRTEKDLRVSLTKYKVLFDSSPDGITISDSGGQIIESNHIAEDLLGLSREEQEKRSISGEEWRIVRPDGTPMPASEFASVRALKEHRVINNVEMGIVKSQNQITWINVSATPIPLEGFGVIISYHDISARKLAEEKLNNALRESQLFRNALDQMSTYIYMKDNQFNYTYANKPTLELFCCSEEELAGCDDYRFFPPETVKQLREIDSRVIQGEQTAEEIDIPDAKDGRHVFWEIKTPIYETIESKTVMGLMGISTDITESKQALESLRQTNDYLENLINYANAPIIVWDPHFHITRFNHASEFITGRREAEVIGQSLEILFPGELINESMALIRKTLTGERWETVEIKIQHLDGSVCTLLWNSATLFKPDGITPLATIAQGNDITLRKKAESELNIKNEELLRTIAEKDKFFSIIAHDLRSPFSSFLGLTQIMSEDLPTLTLEQIQKISRNMRKSASNLYDLLENLLEWSRMQRGVSTFEPSTFLLMKKISETTHLISELAHQKEIIINYEIPETLEVIADENMFETVIRNLTSNAVKFTPRGGGITISAKQPTAELVEIAVSDTGIGMSTDMMANLFRIDKNTNRKGTEGEPSTGLGLILCKDFIEKHDGKLWVESEKGKGSTFYFTLPRSRNK